MPLSDFLKYALFCFVRNVYKEKSHIHIVWHSKCNPENQQNIKCAINLTPISGKLEETLLSVHLLRADFS